MDTFEIIQKGLFRLVTAPQYGRQDIGQSPGGPVDRFSVETGNIMLGNSDFASALEIVEPPILEFRQDSIFAVTGARYEEMRLSKASTGHTSAVEVVHARVEFAEKGDRLSFREKEYGFRLYLCHRPCPAHHSGGAKVRVGRVRGHYRDISTWADSEGRIRVVEGPEYTAWRNPEILLEQVAFTAPQMNDVGIRLTSLSGERLLVNMGSMVSEAVNDGTIQATPQGPIVLLRDRQTIGGYARILNVIGPDVDLLGQCGPNQVVRFQKVSSAEALTAVRRRKIDLDRFRQKWTP